MYLYQKYDAPDPLEPPLIHSKVPVIGHLVAFIHYGIEYFSMQRYLFIDIYSIL